MLLKKLEIHNIGPFTFPVSIEIEEDITILTGPNDTGKSMVLRLLSLLSMHAPVEESDVNLTHLFQNTAGTTWKKDNTIRCVATYQLSSNHKRYIPSNLSIRDNPQKYTLEVQHFLSPAIRKDQIVSIKRDNSIRSVTHSLTQLPTAVTFDTQAKFGGTINLERPQSEIEKTFIEIAFGNNAGERLASLSPINKRLALRKAQTTLNLGLSRLLPSALPLEFVLDWIDANSLQMLIALKDQHGETISLERRGAGVRKIVALMILLLHAERQANDKTIWILIDEPENALHADAQHYLRQFLEGIASSEKIQVIYATHSPAMLNPLKSRSIRLFTRTQKEGVPTSMVNNAPFEDNFYPVRTSLGLSPIDSLLYAPVTIIVEGKTEIYVLPEILLQLEEAGLAEFQGAREIISMCHFLIGGGSRFVYWCRIAQSQGAIPIFFVDADMKRRVEQAQVQKNCPSVAVISLQDTDEIEDIFLDQEIYFAALQDYFNDSSLTVQAFQEWLEKELENNPDFSRRPTSKQIEMWLSIKSSLSYRKPEIMRRAVQKITNVQEQVKIYPFQELMKALHEAIKRI